MHPYARWMASLLLVLGLMLPAATHAQTDVRLGPRIGADFGDVEEVFIGGDVRIDMAGFPVTLNPTFDVYFVDSGSFFSVSANGLYMFGRNNQVFDPYAGAGLGVYRRSGDNFSATDLGLNALFGAEFMLGSLRPFVEAQVSPIFADDSITLFSLKGGLLFGL